MNFAAKILADSLHPNGSRLTTFELTYPRFVHSELMTHRKFSRNSASSRAIPTKVLLRQVKDTPVIPIHWGALQKGMQAFKELKGHPQSECRRRWMDARDFALFCAEQMLELGLHKQIVNRLLEPWMWITVIVTSDERGLANWFKLRCHPDAEPHINLLANLMRDVYDNNTVVRRELAIGDWHLPFINDAELDFYGTEDCVHKSVARCARGSYLQHNGYFEFADDVKLGKKLSEVGHWSAFEHQAKCTDGGAPSNFVSGWLQNRKLYLGEDGCK